MWIEIEATWRRRRTARTSTSGVNAIDRLRAALDRVKELERLPCPAPAAVDRSHQPRQPISETLSGAGEADTLARVTVNIGTIAGGTSPNLVPTHAIARADIRLPVGIATP